MESEIILAYIKACEPKEGKCIMCGEFKIVHYFEKLAMHICENCIEKYNKLKTDK
jgi:hypothetical protein